MKLTGEHMKKGIIILVIVMVVFFVIAGIAFLIRGAQANSKEGSGTEVVEESFSGENVETIKIATVSDDIILKVSQDDSILARFSGNNHPKSKAKLVAKKSGNTLHIDIKRKGFNFLLINFSPGSPLLTVYVPKGYAKNLEVRSTSGDITIEDSYARTLDIENVSGNTKIERTASQSLLVKSVSGHINGERIGAGKVDAETASGDITLSGLTGACNGKSISGEVNLRYTELRAPVSVENASGDVVLTLDKEADMSVIFKTLSGGFKSDYPLVFEKQSGTKVEGKSQNGKFPVRVETATGDFEIKK